jgi:hypothetical protein
MNAPKPWLWPDRVISKRESRVIREEHNAAVNVYAKLLIALRTIAKSERFLGGTTTKELQGIARAALAKEGEK